MSRDYFANDYFPADYFAGDYFGGAGGQAGHIGRGDIRGPAKRPKGLMKDVRQVPFRRYAFDNSEIYRKR